MTESADAAETRAPIDDLPEVHTERDDAAKETVEKYARDQADRLSEAMLDRIARERTGATQAAFFDLDKTVIARSSVLAMSRTFFRDGLISPTWLVKGMYAQAVYLLVGADHERMEQSRHALLELTKGWEAARIERLVRETLEEVIVPYVYQEALDLFDEHRRAGRDVWLVSSSGEEIVRPLAQFLGIPNVVATTSGIDDEGRYDGTIEFYAYSRNKATAVRQIAEARGYDIDGCYCYSDSITDLPFLGVVGNPVAVNPDKELRAAAVAMGWDIRDFISPVSMRDRLPRLPDVEPEPRDLLLAGAAILGIGLLAWRLISRDPD